MLPRGERADAKRDLKNPHVQMFFAASVFVACLISRNDNPNYSWYGSESIVDICAVAALYVSATLLACWAVFAPGKLYQKLTISFFYLVTFWWALL